MGEGAGAGADAFGFPRVTDVEGEGVDAFASGAFAAGAEAALGADVAAGAVGAFD